MSSGRSSPPQNAGNNSAEKVDQFYTNEDVAILHDIVILAQELLPSLPERERLPTNALFGAYHDILPRLGIDASHDSRYARILFRIGGLRDEGSLYEKFEEILSRMGIEIEFEEKEQDLDDQEDAQTEPQNTEAGGIPQNENNPFRGRPRRSSDSAWDIGNDLPKLEQRRKSLSPPSKGRPRLVLDRQSFLQPFQAQTSSGASVLPEQVEIQPGSNVGAWLNSRPAPSLRRRGRSLSTQASFRIRRRSPSLAYPQPAPTINTSDPISDDYHAESEITAVTSVHEQDGPDSVDIPQQQMLSKPSSSLLQIKAEEILEDHLGFLAKRQIRVWRDKALRLREEEANRDLIAAHHDRNALLNQALETWRSRYLENRNIAETERFFAHLERRSVRIRDLYILHRAFSHWHTTALFEAERTRAARRHILRTRVFNAWRDITTINELKVRRHVYKKYFGVWKEKHNIMSSNETTALQKYEGNLAEKIYKTWVRKYWSIRATKWWTEGATQSVLISWATAARKVLQNRRTAQEERRLQLVWNAWKKWRAKIEERIDQEDQAITFRQAYLRVIPLRKWRRETQVVPAKRILQTDIATRLLRDTFILWLHRLRQERQAAELDRTRIIREAWTKWRHKERLGKMIARVNNRVVWDNMYKWVIASRAIETRNEAIQKLAKNSLQHWALNALELRRRRWDQEDLAEQFEIQKSQKLVVEHWSTVSRFQRQLDADAADFHDSRLLHRLLSRWTEKARHLRQLQQWSRDAEFYFQTSKILKRWKGMTEELKREKRKAAYTQVRRITKMNLARGMLYEWRAKTRQVSQMERQARDLSQNKVVIIGMDTFDHWRARTEEIGEMEAMWREGLLRKHFTAWQARSTAFQDLTVEAIINFQERRQSRALKKWNVGILQLRAQSFYATEIQEKNAKRTFRKIFKYWYQKAAERRPVQRVEAWEPSQLGATTKAEAWSEFGDGDEGEGNEWAKGIDEAITSTPAPGYLSTPSRRTDRVAAAAARFSSTTPRAPLSTPFERHLRAQFSGGLVPPQRKGLGKSTLGTGGGFPDITDRSMNFDRGNIE